jgi:hypothetical protein
MTTLLAIDPGNTESAYVIIDPESLAPVKFAKVLNDDLLDLLGDYYGAVYVEMIAAYGMPVGADVFETCVWIGRFCEAHAQITGVLPTLVKRHPVKLHHCHSGKAKDSNVIQALVDRFAAGTSNHGKGTKAQPGWFHGFHSDIWQAYALAVYAADTSGVGASA